MAEKIKIFLGGFVNVTNAQNLNCLAITRHLDKEKFEVHTLELFSGNLESQIGKISGVKIFNCFKPFRISGYLGFLWGIWNCDVAYLPKHEFWKYNRFLLRLFSKKSFSTVEGILDEANLHSAIQVLGSKEQFVQSKSYCTNNYAITKFLGGYNFEHHQIKVEPKPLYLGCEIAEFSNHKIKRGLLKKAVYIGRLKKRKGVYDFLAVALHFPQQKFYIFGNGEEEAAIKTYLMEHEMNNVALMGVTGHVELAKFLQDVDLHILPSRSEGFPKVTLETAAAGVPSVVYSDYGAEEWMKTGENGWVVNTIEEINAIVAHLIENPSDLQKVANGAVKLAENFDWEIKIKDWEGVIDKLYNT